MNGFYVTIEANNLDQYDALMRFYKEGDAWQEEILLDEDNILGIIAQSSKKYMSYMEPKDIVSYLHNDGDFGDIKIVEYDDAKKFVEDNSSKYCYNPEEIL